MVYFVNPLQVNCVDLTAAHPIRLFGCGLRPCERGSCAAAHIARASLRPAALAWLAQCLQLILSAHTVKHNLNDLQSNINTSRR